MTTLSDRPVVAVINDSELLGRAVGAYERSMTKTDPAPIPSRCFHVAIGSTEYVVIIGERDMLQAYRLRSDGRLRVARELPDEMPLVLESRIVQHGPDGFAAAIRLPDGMLLQHPDRFVTAAQAERWIREVAASHHALVADDIPLSAARAVDVPSAVLACEVQVPRYRARLLWSDYRQRFCPHEHLTQQEAEHCGRSMVADLQTAAG